MGSGVRYAGSFASPIVISPKKGIDPHHLCVGTGLVRASSVNCGWSGVGVPVGILVDALHAAMAGSTNPAL